MLSPGARHHESQEGAEQDLCLRWVCYPFRVFRVFRGGCLLFFAFTQSIRCAAQADNHKLSYHEGA